MMKLSEAMRLGAMMHPQGFGRFKSYKDGGAVVATCAMGAVQEAVSGLPAQICYWPWPIVRTPVLCPEPYCRKLALVEATIIHLNDDHIWTRERIADWIEQLENQQGEQHGQDKHDTDQEHAVPDQVDAYAEEHAHDTEDCSVSCSVSS